MLKQKKVVILAAGSGKRLKLNIPKAMVELKKDLTIMDWQLTMLSRFFSFDDILIVVGYKKELLMERYHYLQFVYNRDFDITNTGKSLLLALKKLRGNDVLWINGDVIFDPVIIEKAIVKMTGNFVAGNSARVGSEEVKYQLDQENNLTAISKELFPAKGEAVGINFIRAEFINDFIEELERIKEQDYFEKGLENLIINRGVKFQAMDIGNLFCVEVDFQKDLQRAKRFVARYKTSG